MSWNTSTENNMNQGHFVCIGKEIADADVLIITLDLFLSHLHPAPFSCGITVQKKTQLSSNDRNSTRLCALALSDIDTHNRNLPRCKYLFGFDRWPSPSAQNAPATVSICGLEWCKRRAGYVEDVEQ